MNKVDIFAVYNDTNKYAVLVDDYYGLFDSKAAAVACHTQASDQFDDYHGALQILPPNQVPASDIFGARYAPLSKATPIDIAGYVSKRASRAAKEHAGHQDVLAKNNLPARFAVYKWSKIDTGDVDSYDYLDFDFDSPESIWRDAVSGVDYDSYSYRD